MFKKLCFFLILISFFSVFGCKISGTITVDEGDPGGVTVALSGGSEMTATTDAGGNYTFKSLMPGEYVVTPSKDGYIFDPESVAVSKTGLFADVGGIDFEAIPDNMRIVFITQDDFTGSLGGLEGADAKCQAEADAVEGLTGTYMAWLSDSSESPDNRFNKDGGPFILTDGTIVADDWEDLTDGALQHAINMHADGSPVTEDPSWPLYPWTNTMEGGTLHSAVYTCDDWTSEEVGGDAPRGRHGWADDNDVLDSPYQWTRAYITDCNNPRYLYCFEQ